MNLRIITLTLFAGLLFACEKTEDPNPGTSEAVIDGESFESEESSATITGDHLVLSFGDASKFIEITTNDTVAGTYVILPELVKSSGLKATITYTEGTTEYNGTGGSLILEKSGGVYSGTYSATVQSEENEVLEISSGTFTNIESEEAPVVITEADIHETLESGYLNLTGFIEMEYLFDAVYSNETEAPNSAWSDIYLHLQDPSNEKVSNLWNEAYDIIEKANFVVNNASEVVSDKELESVITAQAQTVRAYAYFKLLKWFGGVPVVTGPGDIQLPRNSAEEVLDYVTSDLVEAVYSLPQLWPSGDNRITKAFAQGILSRAYLWDGHYAESYDISQDIINSGNYILSLSPDQFSQDHEEIFWGFPKGENPEFNAFFQKGDFVPGARYTETFLAYAEANYAMGNTSHALDLINELKFRRGETIVTEVNAETLYQQYRTELGSEGEAFSVLQRFEKWEDVLMIPEYKLVLPIPMSVLGVNPNMVQNVGY